MYGFGSMQFLTRKRATQYIKDKGIPIGGHSLAFMATSGRGPAYSILNGRALYRPDDLDAWIESEALRMRRQGH